MNKNFTFLYVINDFEQNENQFADINDLFSKNEEEFEDVIEFLNKIEFAPRQKVLNKIADFLNAD